MPYISLDNLTQYNGRLRDYIDGSFDKLDGANWRKTSAAQSVSCWPIPESPLEPEVTFKFSETQPESGTKGPDNPSTIVGVESVSCNVCESEGVYDTPYSIDLGDTYYGGTINFATGVLEVTHGVLILDGTENWSTPTQVVEGIYRHGFTRQNGSMYSLGSNGESSCTHFNYIYDANAPQISYYLGGYSAQRLMYVNMKTSFSTAEAQEAWLASEYSAGHPVTITGLLYVPFTVPLTPVLVRSLPALSHYTPRQNTIYTPHESVQVGYAKSASKTSQDLANAIVALGGNV